MACSPSAPRGSASTGAGCSNRGYGVFARYSRGVTYAFNRAERNGEPGFYVGDSPRADVLITGTRPRSTTGAKGILLRNAQGGRVEHNRLQGNCSGLIVLAGAPGPAGRFRIARNRVVLNNRFCAGDPAEGEPPVSGIGIALAGAFRTEVVRNVVLGNRPSRRCDDRCVFPGGIVAVTFGRFRPARDLVALNTALSNRSVDLRWDRSGTVGFTRNRCTSRPRGLCPRPRVPSFTG